MSIDIPAPFSAIARSGPVLLLSGGKRIDLSTLFGSQFSIGGVSLLSRPIELWAQRTGGTLQQITATPVVTAEEPGMITLGWNWVGNGFSASGTILVYAEGRIQYDFRLTPDVATKWDKLYWIVPFADGLAELMTKFPRENTTETNAKAIPWDYTPVGSATPGWGSSATFPRTLWIHNETHGIAWGMDSDACVAPSIGDADGSRRARIAVTADELRFDIIRATTPVFAGATANPLEYRFHLMPCPPKQLDPATFMDRFGDEGSTPALTNYRPLTEETGHYLWMGSGVMIDEAAAAILRAARLARGLKDMRYFAFGLAPNRAPGWNPAYKCNVGDTNKGYQNDPNGLGYPQYPQYHDGVAYYSLEPAIIANIDFQDWRLSELADVVNLTDAYYFDLTDYKVQAESLDAFGRTCFRYGITETCDYARRVSAQIHGAGKKMLSHPQGDFCPMRDCFFDWVLPGEQWRDEIGNLSGNARRRFYLDGLPEAQLRAELCAVALGTNIVLLPGWVETDYLTTDEWQMTETMGTMASMHGVGIWHSTTARAAMRRLFTAQKQLAGQPLVYTSPWSTSLVSTADANARVATFQVGNTLVAEVINLSDTDRTIAITLARAATSQSILYWGTGQSPAESRPAPGYTATLSGNSQAFNVGVARKNSTQVLFELAPVATPKLPTKLVGLLNLLRILRGVGGSVPKLVGPN
jgi:hypothetical protein